MTDASNLAARVAALADHQRERTAAKADANRAKAPEFAQFVDQLRGVFGNVRVTWVRWADGSEQGRRGAGA